VVAIATICGSSSSIVPANLGITTLQHTTIDHKQEQSPLAVATAVEEKVKTLGPVLTTTGGGSPAQFLLFLSEGAKVTALSYGTRLCPVARPGKMPTHRYLVGSHLNCLNHEQ
jgi:hypothetical protein